jgi:hypothetical protein
MLGCQDNGRQVRVGETVWEVKATMQGDGGGVIFHPLQSQFVMGQFNSASWAADPSSRFAQPVVMAPNNQPADPENAGSSFYSGIAAITQPASNRARIALGTNRVWISDDLGGTTRNSWNVLPITAAGAFVGEDDLQAFLGDARSLLLLAQQERQNRHGCASPYLLPPNRRCRKPGLLYST